MERLFNTVETVLKDHPIGHKKIWSLGNAGPSARIMWSFKGDGTLSSDLSRQVSLHSYSGLSVSQQVRIEFKFGAAALLD